MKKSHAWGGVLAALLVVAAGPSRAEFVNEGGVGELRIIGRIAKEEAAAGMGRNVSLRDAVRQVVPSDYAVSYIRGAEAFGDKRVSWKGGRPWTEVFADLVANIPELTVEIDARTRLVTLTSGNVATAAATGDVGQTEWRIRSGDRLSETLSTWGKEAGWQGVFWEAPDLVSDINVAFGGTFEEAVTQTIQALTRHGMQLRVVFYGGNKVVRIVESK